MKSGMQVWTKVLLVSLVWASALVAVALLGQGPGEHSNVDVLIYGLLLMVVVAPLATYVHTDMEARGRHGLAYAAAVVFAFPAGLALWLLMRRAGR